jgi:hypothetical protein
VKIEWSPAARASARRYMADKDGMRAIGMAIAGLAYDPCPPGAFHRGDYHRLRVGPYRVISIRRTCPGASAPPDVSDAVLGRPRLKSVLVVPHPSDPRWSRRFLIAAESGVLWTRSLSG